MDRSRRTGSQYEISLESKELYLLIAGLLLFMVLLFIFGIFVGKKMEHTQVDSEIGPPVAAAPDTEPVREALPGPDEEMELPGPEEAGVGEDEDIPAAGPGAGEKGEDIQYTYYDSLVKGKDVGIQPGPGPEAEAEPEEEEPPSPPPAVRSAPIPKDAPVTAPPVSQEGKYTIQIASFLEREQAQNLVRWLRERGYPAFMITAEIEGRGTWHRVRVGRFPSKEEANTYQKQLEKKIHLRGFIARFE